MRTAWRSVHTTNAYGILGQQLNKRLESFAHARQYSEAAWRSVSTSNAHIEMEFLDINLTKDSSFLLYARQYSSEDSMEVSQHHECTYRVGILGRQFNKKYSSLLLHAIHSPFYWRILKKTVYSTLVLIILTKKSVKQENSSLFMNSILLNGKRRVETHAKIRV